MEQIALDMGALWARTFPLLRADAWQLRDRGLVARMRAGGYVLWGRLGEAGVLSASTSSSDTVRGWAAMAIGVREDLTLEERLNQIRPFANDPHFAVREWAWLSVRSHVRDGLDDALASLTSWASHGSDNVRRFASEVTRPRGVWSAHIHPLRYEPWRGLPILDRLSADSSRYVQASVGNWLNDASKDCDEWVIATCKRWLSDSPTPATQWICRRALRTISRS